MEGIYALAVKKVKILSWLSNLKRATKNEFDNPAQWVLTETIFPTSGIWSLFDNPAQWVLTETGCDLV